MCPDSFEMTEVLHCGLSLSGEALGHETKKGRAEALPVERKVTDYSAGGGGVSVPFAIFCKCWLMRLIWSVRSCSALACCSAVSTCV